MAAIVNFKQMTFGYKDKIQIQREKKSVIHTTHYKLWNIEKKFQKPKIKLLILLKYAVQEKKVEVIIKAKSRRESDSRKKRW